MSEEAAKVFENPLITKEIEIILLENLARVLDGSITLDDLTKLAFKRNDLDGRSKEGRAVKTWFVSRGHTPKPIKSATNTLELADEQKEFIRNNMETMRPMEIARILFPGKRIYPLSKEFLIIQSFIGEIRPDSIPPSERMAEGPYEPPKSIYRLVPRVNDYIARFKMEGVKPLPLDEKLLTEQQLKMLRKLLGYLNNHTFVHSINIYGSVQERELFESRFIRYTYDKPDLTEEEVDSYISVCDKSVALHQIRGNIQTLQREININLESGDSERKKVAMSFIELLNSYRQKESDAEATLDKTLRTLVGTREARLKGRLQNNATVLNLVTAWQTEEKRKELIELAKRQREAEKDAVGKLSNMDAVTALIAGFSKEQAMYGQ